jgi:molybdopterin-biosynthesis enzyme MoeA-like protein
MNDIRAIRQLLAEGADLTQENLAAVSRQLIREESDLRRALSDVTEQFQQIHVALTAIQQALANMNIPVEVTMEQPERKPLRSTYEVERDSNGEVVRITAQEIRG